MTTNSAELLKMLGSLAAPGAAPAAGSAAKAAGVDFASLLKLAGQGELSSGLGVTVAKGVNVDLTAEQLSRIAAAADKAQAQGAARALVMIDGKALTLDVGVRQITGQADLKGVVTGVDAVVNVPPSTGGDPAAPKVLPLPRAGFAGPSLLKALGIAVSPAA